MKRISLIILLMMFAALTSMAVKSYEMQVLNLVQVTESEFKFDIRMRNLNPSDPFAIEAIQWQLSFNNALMNGGSLNNAFLFYVPGTTDLVGTDIIPQNGNISTNQVIIQWVTSALPNNAQTTLFNTGDWKRIGTFRVQLRNAGNTAFQNFSDVAHSLAFVPGQVTVTWCNYTTTSGLYYRDGAFFELITSQTLTNSLSSRKLAGYCFTGTGNWTAAARWNNVTTANFNTLPGVTNNVIIAGSTTVSDTRTVKDVTLAQGSYMAISPLAQLTTDNLYNDNTGGGGTSTVTLAGWNFENGAKRVINTAYSADDGTTPNKDIALLSGLTGAYRYQVDNAGTNYVARGTGWEIGDFWQVASISASGYGNLKLNYKMQNSNAYPTGDLTWQLQSSPDGNAPWTSIKTLTVSGTSWVIESNVSLPTNLDGSTNIYLRWVLQNDPIIGGRYFIDDIVITGETPPTGLLIQSTSGGTGSLLHSNTGVEAKVERYITGWTGSPTPANHGWHFLSSPVAAQPISVFHTAGSGNDFYKWVESNPNAEKWVNRTATGGGLYGSFETNFAVGTTGYLMANAATSTPVFTGVLNVSDVPVTGLTNSTGTFHAGWHLLGNPFSCALGFSLGTWNRSNVGAVAQIWNELNASYTVLSDSQVIPAMNGFMVYSAVAGGSLTIPADARVQDNTAWYKSNAATERILLKADDPEGQTAQETIIAFNNAATDGFDMQYDGYFMSGWAPSFYSKANNEDFALNTLPALSSDLVIPLGFVKNGSANFNIRLVENIPGVTVYLKDLKLNRDQDLTTFPVYNFTSADGDNANRFQLHFGTVLVNETSMAQPVNIYGVNNTIYIASKTGKAMTGDVVVYNMIGQAMISQPLCNNGLTKISVNSGTGYYVVKVITPDQIFSGKVFIK